MDKEAVAAFILGEAIGGRGRLGRTKADENVNDSFNMKVRANTKI